MQQWYQCPYCKAPVQYGQPYCNNCRNQIQWNQPVQPQYNNPEYQQQPDQKPQSNFVRNALITIAVITVLIIIGIILPKSETITVMGKGAKQRVVRIGLSCQKALLKYLYMRHDNQPCLWLNIWRNPITGDGIQQILKVLKVRAGITGRCSPHSLRHSFATMALTNGAGEFEVQSLLGHSTLTMTRKYVQTLNSQAAVLAHKRWSPVDNLHLK